MQPMNRLRIKRMNKKKQCEFQNSIENCRKKGYRDIIDITFTFLDWYIRTDTPINSGGVRLDLWVQSSPLNEIIRFMQVLFL